MLKTIFFDPLYNTLTFLSAHMPGADLGLAIITLTIVVKLVLLPFYHQSLITQIKLKRIDPEIKKIKTEAKGDKTLETTKLLALYKTNKINPFIGVVVMLVQVPIIIALFYVFKSSLGLVGANHIFLGILDVTTRSYGAAVLTGLTQFFQIKLSLPTPLPVQGDHTIQDDLTRSMHWQMKYFMPIMIAVIAAGLPSALSLYWITSNVFAISYELLIRRRLIASELKPLSNI